MNAGLIEETLVFDPETGEIIFLVVTRHGRREPFDEAICSLLSS